MEYSKLIFHIDGNINGERISTSNFDIEYEMQMLEWVNSLLGGKEKGRPLIVHTIEDGSYMGVFLTSLQRVAQVAAVLAMVIPQNDISHLEPKTAETFEDILSFSRANGLSVKISTEHDNASLLITPKTQFKKQVDVWVDGEFYFYGVVTDAGGKNKSNIHLDTGEGTITITVDKDALAKREDNILYKQYGARVTAKQNIITGELDKDSIRLIELLGFNPVFDADDLIKHQQSAAKAWEGVDVDKFLSEIRGYA